MSLESLAKREVTTSLGVVPLWSRPDAYAARRPLVLAITGLLAGPDDLAGLPPLVEQLADVAIVRLPGVEPIGLSDPSLDGFSRAIGEVIDQIFSDRPVVLLGVSLGATAALAVRAGAVRRMVAVEPILETGPLWPVVETVQPHLAQLPPTALDHAIFARHFGVSAQRLEPRDYRDRLAGLPVPVDVLLGATPLEPRRRLKSFPSLVGAAARAELAATPGVRLHLAAGAGHHVQAEAAKALQELLMEACRRASAPPPYDLAGLDEALVEATPLTARRVLHWGPGARAFAGAYLSWNPAAQIEVLGEDADVAIENAGAGFDALVLGARPAPAVSDRLVTALAHGGDLIARWTTPGERADAALAAAGLVLGPPADLAGTGVLRARKGGYADPPLRLDVLAFASRLMDVRTRLPARGLSASPEIEVRYALPPYTPLPLPFDKPKILLLQRQGPIELEEGRRTLAYCIARGWLVVIEYDDHPALVAEAHGRPFDGSEMPRFGWAHAVQTATQALAEVFRQHNPEVAVFGNTVFELAPFPSGPPPRRVFYGAISRGSIGVEVARSLEPVVAEFPDLEFVVLGDPAVFAALPTSRKVYEPFLTYEAYLARMADCAISLSPVEAQPNRATKSDAKFLDAARAGVVTIGSPVIYAGTIRHGENGLLAPALADWAPTLRQALADPVALRAIGRRAWDEVREQRMFARQAPQRLAWYRDLWARREALTAAVVARVPGLAQAVAAERARLA